MHAAHNAGAADVVAVLLMQVLGAALSSHLKISRTWYNSASCEGECVRTLVRMACSVLLPCCCLLRGAG
jgi:hypothetical protein